MVTATDVRVRALADELTADLLPDIYAYLGTVPTGARFDTRVRWRWARECGQQVTGPACALTPVRWPSMRNGRRGRMTAGAAGCTRYKEKREPRWIRVYNALVSEAGLEPA